MPVVVVESPAKARTIEKYLGPGYRVLASFGHVRDLPEKDGSVDTDNEFAMVWEVQSKAQSHVKAIADALKNDSDLILATDPDREGEAISWHVREVLAKRRGVKLPGESKRVVFNAITKSAVRDAMESPRKIDMQLVDAYLARRALDYLVGYTLSPVLWRKLPGARSAGRVQSVCVRLIVEREAEIEAFKPREYWSIAAKMETERQEGFLARLSILDGKKLKKYDLSSGEDADRAVKAVRDGRFNVASVESKPVRRNPPPPFVTATLQQEASLKLRLKPRLTMSIAQKLYEAGLITYMRTDGIFMAPEAVSEARSEIRTRFGNGYLPGKPRAYKNKAKNAQEAHECIRPTNMALDSGSIRVSDTDQRKLYGLIWKRAMASQMESARYLRATCDLLTSDEQTGLRATGRVLQFDGYLKLYEEDATEGSSNASNEKSKGARKDDQESEAENARLPEMKPGEPANVMEVKPEQHHTQPPPRYTEASLVKKMVELGIGRPSTYSSIVSTIQDRGYVGAEKGNLVPRGMGRMLTGFLTSYFAKYVEYEFTAGLEEDLDDVSGGRKKRLDVLQQFWTGFTAAVDDTKELRIGEVLDKLSDMLVPQLVPVTGETADPRLCPSCRIGRLTLRTGRGFGAFIGCSNYPECGFSFNLDGGGANGPNDMPAVVKLGTDPDTGLEVTARSGRFGPYLQLGEASKDKGAKPKRVSIPKGMSADTLDLGTALELIALPRKVGDHPEDGLPIEAGIGRYGPYLKHGRKYANISDPVEVLSIGINRAVDLLALSKQRFRSGQGATNEGRQLGEHPQEGGPVSVLEGPYGPYVKWNKVNAKIVKGTDPSEITLERAVELIEARRATKSKKNDRSTKSRRNRRT